MIYSPVIVAGCCSTKITPSAAGFKPLNIVAKRCIDFYPNRQHLIVTNLGSSMNESYADYEAIESVYTFYAIYNVNNFMNFKVAQLTI